MKNETYETKARYFLENKAKVHIKVKSGLFYNGFILEVNSDFLMLDDHKLGETPIFFLEIIDIIKYEVRE